MSARLELRGLDELRSALRNLPEDLTQEANAIVRSHAEEAARDIRNGYPEGPTGNLRRGVTVEVNSSKFGSAAIVRSRAPHAHLFESGTKVRYTGGSSNIGSVSSQRRIRRILSGRETARRAAHRGAMPPAPAEQRFVPKAIRARARMVSALKDLVRRAGLVVED